MTGASLFSPVTAVPDDPPVIAFLPSALLLSPDPSFGAIAEGTILGVTFDPDDPFIIAFSTFTAVSWSFNLSVLDLTVFPITINILLPTGVTAIGTGMAGIADFIAFGSPFLVFEFDGGLDVVSVDFNGNTSFGFAPVFLENLFGPLI